MGFLAKLQSALTNSPASVAAQALQFATHHGRVLRRTQEVEPATQCHALFGAGVEQAPRLFLRPLPVLPMECLALRQAGGPSGSIVGSVVVMALFATCCTSRTF